MNSDRSLRKFDLWSRFGPSTALALFHPTVVTLVESFRCHDDARVVLATASPPHVETLYETELDRFDHVITSCRHRNLKGEEKLSVVLEYCGEHFFYVGNSVDDIPLFEKSVCGFYIGSRTAFSRIKKQLANPNKLHRIRPVRKTLKWRSFIAFCLAKS